MATDKTQQGGNIMAIDAIYALQAPPAPNQFKPTQAVKQLSNSAEVAAEHEEQQNTLIPATNERRKRQDRRRKQRAVALERRQANRRQQNPVTSAPDGDSIDNVIGSGHIIDVIV
ncbi:hypothetical protein [Shewanella sp.]|uniref:hypothetical protein n=1 Tax=Shewanella sp. TaxID=50422 RepID=UPI003A982F19